MAAIISSPHQAKLPVRLVPALPGTRRISIMVRAGPSARSRGSPAL
jgi:hypothetical protein